MLRTPRPYCMCLGGDSFRPAGPTDWVSLHGWRISSTWLSVERDPVRAPVMLCSAMQKAVSGDNWEIRFKSLSWSELNPQCRCNSSIKIFCGTASDAVWCSVSTWGIIFCFCPTAPPPVLPLKALNPPQNYVDNAQPACKSFSFFQYNCPITAVFL